jgi:hypothetical protein
MAERRQVVEAELEQKRVARQTRVPKSIIDLQAAIWRRIAERLGFLDALNELEALQASEGAKRAEELIKGQQS